MVFLVPRALVRGEYLVTKGSEQWLPRRQGSSGTENVFTVVCLFIKGDEIAETQENNFSYLSSNMAWRNGVFSGTFDRNEGWIEAVCGVR